MFRDLQWGLIIMINDKRVVCVIQARMNSTRLPGKTLLPLAGKPVLGHMIERMRRSEYIDEVVVACTESEHDQVIIDLLDMMDCRYHRGSEHDVLTRVLETAKKFEADIIVELTSDCPCCDPGVADKVIEGLIEGDKIDYSSNVINRTYARGLDVQAFTMEALERTNLEVDNLVDRSHVSTWMYKNPKTNDIYKKCSHSLYGHDFHDIRLTLDTEDDYELLRLVFNAFPNNHFDCKDLIRLVQNYPELFELNADVPQKSYYKELTDAYKV